MSCSEDLQLEYRTHEQLVCARVSKDTSDPRLNHTYRLWVGIHPLCCPFLHELSHLRTTNIMMMIAFIITLAGRNDVVIAFGTLSSFLTLLHIVSGVVCVVCPFAGDEILKTFMSI